VREPEVPRAKPRPAGPDRRRRGPQAARATAGAGSRRVPTEPVPPADTPPASQSAMRRNPLSASRSEPADLCVPGTPIRPGVTQFGTTRWVPVAAGAALVLLLLALILLLVV
jgi:hypothetical protein